MCKQRIGIGNFPENISPIYKKGDPFDKKNYRPVSILLLVSRTYERVKYQQTSNYFESFFKEILCGFRKVHKITCFI